MVPGQDDSSPPRACPERLQLTDWTTRVTASAPLLPSDVVVCLGTCRNGRYQTTMTTTTTTATTKTTTTITTTTTATMTEKMSETTSTTTTGTVVPPPSYDESVCRCVHPVPLSTSSVARCPSLSQRHYHPAMNNDFLTSQAAAQLNYNTNRS